MVAQERLEYEISVDDNTAAGAAAVGGTLGQLFLDLGVLAETVGGKLEEGIDEAVEDTRQGPLARLRQALDENAERFGATLTVAVGGVLTVLNNFLDQLDERRNALELRLFTPTGGEEDLQNRLLQFGFTPDETASGILATRAFGLAPDSQEAFNVSQTATALTRVGVNTRFLPQLAREFGLLDDPDQLVAQLGVGADVVSQAGVDFEEVYSEIADNPQVYGAFPTFAHAAQFIVSQGLVPSEVTIQLEQGFLAPRGGAVTGDPYTLTGITPSAADRFANRPVSQAIIGAVGAVPFVGEGVGELLTGVGTLTERITGSDLDRTGRTELTLRGEAGSVLVDGIAVISQAAQANERLARAVERATARREAGETDARTLGYPGRGGRREYLQNRTASGGD